MLEVRLLGKFEIKQDQKLITISSRPAQSLFAYLILSAGTAHRREKLAGMLWPDSLEETARDNLRHALWRMRKALESASSMQFLRADDVTIGFKESAEYWLDAAELERLNEQASADDLIAVLSNYQGELLPGFYDEWVLLEREHLNSIFEHHMARLMSLLQEENRWLEILEWGERWIKLGQKPEPAYRALMTAHAAKGDMSRVAATFERCVKSLQEFGIEPSEQTKELYRNLKSGKEIPETLSVSTNPFAKEISSNIPVPLTSFIGRERELKEIGRLLSASRLITLTGPGGVGKTRLAIQAAHDSEKKFKDGVFWVGLVGLSDENLIPQEIAKSLRVREIPAIPLMEILKQELKNKDMLLVLDNCEHLIDAAARTTDQLLSSCPNLKILTTSRERLGIFNETAWNVPSLSENTSHQLFAERARAAQYNFALSDSNESVIAQICQRLDGIPLAIELAAARVAVISVEEIARRLDHRFSLLTSGSRTALPRQQTLRAAIDWSYDLLTEPERILLRRLAVFAGGFTLEAAEEVCGFELLKRNDVLDLLGKLVAKSLLIVEIASHGGSTRYRLLETIREYAVEKLIESNEESIVRDHHMEFFSQLVTTAEPKLITAERLQWVRHLEAEHDNLLSAIDWSLQSKNTDFALQIVGALTERDAWHNSGLADRSLQVVQSPLTSQSTLLRVKALRTAGVMQWFQGNRSQARAFLEEAVAIGREFRNQDSHIYALANLSSAVAAEGDYDAARAYLEEGLAAARKLGTRGTASMGYVLAFLGDILVLQGDPERAQQMYEESIARLRELNNRNFLPYPIRRLSELALVHAEYEKAIVLCKESLALNLEDQDQNGAVASLAEFAAIAAARQKFVVAARLYAAVEHLLVTIPTTLLPIDQEAYERNVAMLRSQLDEATLSAAWAQGGAMTLERAIEFALKEAE